MLTSPVRYVRLFLRKTDSWHRIGRLRYYDDISEPEVAVRTLQSDLSLPEAPGPTASQTIDGIVLEDDALGGSFTFADRSEEYIDTVEEAASLLNLDELKALAKEAKIQGKNKADLFAAFCRLASQQATLPSLGLRRSSTNGSDKSRETSKPGNDLDTTTQTTESQRRRHYLDKVLAITGPCIRLSPKIFKLFERVHFVFYRTTEWTEKSLTTIILAKISKRNFPEYVVCRSSNIFDSRLRLLEFEAAKKLEAEVDGILESNGPATEENLQKMIDIAERIYPRWRTCLHEEQRKEDEIYDIGEGSYLRRFTAAHTYTRILSKASYAYGRLKQYKKEHDLLTDLLGQRLFHPARRGGWYQRKAILEEHYMHAVDEAPDTMDIAQRKKHWKRIALATCEAGLEDNDTHVIYHYDLQKRVVKLERQLKVPRRQQHDFGHVKLMEPVEDFVQGIQLKRREDPLAANKAGQSQRAATTKTAWLDELGDGGECSVEAMCLSWYRSQGWKGYHSEGGIVRTLFAYLFFDILFIYVPNVFQTAFQTCPLDLHTDAFYQARAPEINRRLADIANGGAERLIHAVEDAGHRERRTCVVGLRWDFELDDLLELARCFPPAALATVCKVLAQEYQIRSGGLPDLILWRPAAADTGPKSQEATMPPAASEMRGECMFVEVKSSSDRLSDTQRLWIHVLAGAGLKVVLCNAVAREVRTIDG